MLINVVKHANVQIRVKPDDDGNEVDDDVVDDYDGKDGVQYDDGKDSVHYSMVATMTLVFCSQLPRLPFFSFALQATHPNPFF